MCLHKPRTLFEIATLAMIIKVSFSLSCYIPYSESVDLILSVLSAILYAYCILLDKYDYKTLFVYGIVGLISLYSVIKTGNYGFLITILACFAVRKRDFNRFIRIIFEYELLFVVLHAVIALLLGGFGQIPLYVFEKGMNRMMFGFTNPNTFSIYIFNLILMWIWLNYYRLQRKHLFCIFIIAFTVVSFTKTRTMLIDCVILLLLCNLYYGDKSRSTCKRIAALIVPVLASMTWLLVILYTKNFPIAYIVDRALNARIKLGAYAFNHVGVSAFGQYMLDFRAEWDNVWQLNHFTFDNIYTYLVCNQGFVWLILISIVFIRLTKVRNNLVNVLLIVWALYGTTEVHGLNGFLCMPIFLCAFAFKDKYKELFFEKRSYNFD